MVDAKKNRRKINFSAVVRELPDYQKIERGFCIPSKVEKTSDHVILWSEVFIEGK